MDALPLIDNASIELEPVESHGGAHNGNPTSSSVNAENVTRIVSGVEDGEKEKNKEKKHQNVTTLKRQWWILVPVLLYATLAVSAWSILCVLTFRPITTSYYNSYFGRRSHPNPDQFYRGPNLQKLYAENQRWLQAVRVIQSIVSVLTIPLTSAVCSAAAVVFSQRSAARRKLSLRQVITLADHGWTDPATFVRLCSGNFRKYYASTLLFVAIFVNVLGGIISPLQSIFLTTSTTKTPTSPSYVFGITDVLDLLGPNSTPVGLDDNQVSVLTRSAITSTFNTDPQSRLWSRGLSNCSDPTNSPSPEGPYGSPSPASPCNISAFTLSQISQLTDPFLAYLPAGFSTGLITQFIPRMNSTVTRENVSVAEFPVNCDALPGAFYVHFAHAGDFNDTNLAGNWSMTACMPANQSASPWSSTRDRQDISEQLYLNISVDGYLTDGDALLALNKITLNSTLGYFELPNYSNGQAPGPLLDKDPWGPLCSSNGSDCEADLNPQLPLLLGQYRRDTNNDSAGISNTSVILQSVPNKGPLLLIAMALFGENSFIANRYQHPQVYLLNESNSAMWANVDAGANIALFQPYCVDQAPMIGLLAGPSAQPSASSFGGCIENMNNQDDILQRLVEEWLLALTNQYPASVIANAFEAAAFLANEAWLVQGQVDNSLYVNYDLGADTEVPVISVTGIALISSLLAIYMVVLLALALYSARVPVWTRHLDAYAMMRIGAAVADEITLVCVRDVGGIAALDRLPGEIGDATNGRGDVGELGLGASAPLSAHRKMRCVEEL